MKLEVVNQTKERVSKKWLQKWVHLVVRELRKKKSLSPKDAKKNLTIVFVSRAVSQKLNVQFRGKKKPTDVLSFAPVEKGSLGELVLCMPVLKKQAREHDLSLNEEVGYMNLHGILHLLGYDHEKSAVQARKMFKLQDVIFEKLTS
jgi:probable rRNA maturation factor